MSNRTEELSNYDSNICISQQLRSTRTAAVEQQEAMDDEQGEAFLGFEGEDFTFEQLDNEVSFESCSVEKADLGAIEDYILSN